MGGSTKARKEIYVFTDLGRPAWPADAAARLRDKLAAKSDVALYMIDVGLESPQDFALGNLHLSADVLARNTPLNLETELVRLGPEEEIAVSAWIVDAEGQPQKRAQTTARPQPDQSQVIDFQIDGLDQGTHQGYVRIAGEDSLPADDARYFTVDVRPPWKVLVAAHKPAQRRAIFLTEALAPAAFRRTSQARFECDVVPLDDLTTKPLDDYAAVCLLDPPPMSDPVWLTLTNYVDHGGGLAIWLGRNAQPKGHSVDDFNTPAALKVMPGRLAQQWHRQDAFLAPQDYQHPLLAKFRGIAGSVPWDAFTVWSHWKLADLADGVNTVIPYSNGQPALLEAQRRQGPRARVHHSDFRRSHRFRSVEPAGRRRRAVAVCDALQRNAVLSGRQRRGTAELSRRRSRRDSPARGRTAIDLLDCARRREKNIRSRSIKRPATSPLPQPPPRATINCARGARRGACAAASA